MRCGMKYIDEKCEVLENKLIAPDIFDLTVRSEFIAEKAGCGQFANILCDGKMLRRPISICDSGDGVVRFVYQVKGGGTKWLSERSAGDTLEVFGPLGNGFSMPDGVKKLTLIGGGIGIPPMFKTLKTAAEKGIKTKVILGARTKDLVILEDEFKKYADEVAVCTDDGSYGKKGFVTDILADTDTDCVMACGPVVMLSAVHRACRKRGVLCYVSLEERMGCGVGACVCCVCKVKTRDFEGYKQVCKAGPVFDSCDIDWYSPRIIKKSEFDGVRNVREQVFCSEQGYAHQVEFDEFDEFPDNVSHIAAFDCGRAIACGRVINEGGGKFKIGRIAVLPQYRGLSVGKDIVSALIDEAKRSGAEKIVVDAQVTAVEFYEKLGFKIIGEPHPDGHIMHRLMEL